MGGYTAVEIAFWIVLAPLAAIAIGAWIYRLPDRGVIPHVLRVYYSRLWGEYRRIRRGTFLESGEHETCRTQLVGVTAYSVDRHVTLQSQSTCIVTDRRVVMCDFHGSRVEVLGSHIRAVRSRRTYDPADGFSYSVVLERLGSAIHDPEGDMLLIASGARQSESLFAALDDLCSTQCAATTTAHVHP